MVFGALDRLGQLVVRHMVKDGAYKPAIQVNREYRDYMRFTADGVSEEADKYDSEICVYLCMRVDGWGR